MKPNDLTLQQWQDMIDAFKTEKPNAKPKAAFRIDGTQFSTARYYGGFTFEGDEYRVVYFDDGAMLGVRLDFLRWVERKLREGANATGEKPMENTFWDKTEETK